MEYITVAEYAAAAHISKQTAYNRSKSTKYEDYFRKIRGVLMVDKSILEVKERFNLDLNAAPLDTQAAAADSIKSDSSLDSTLIETLKEQLERQAQQIEKLYAMVAEKDSTIKELSATIAQITATIQALQHEQNLLEAGKLQTETPPREAAETVAAEPRKKGLISFFRRRG